jgi:hypothetical protein
MQIGGEVERGMRRAQWVLLRVCGVTPGRCRRLVSTASAPLSAVRQSPPTPRVVREVGGLASLQPLETRVRGGALPDYLQLILNARVYEAATVTPLMYAHSASAREENSIWLKREDLQPVFSFKIRGAYNRMAHLTPEGELSVDTDRACGQNVTARFSASVFSRTAAARPLAAPPYFLARRAGVWHCHVQRWQSRAGKSYNPGGREAEAAVQTKIVATSSAHWH